MRYDEIVQEAPLSGKRTNGTPAWDYYVVQNEKWQELELTVEKPTPVFNSHGDKEGDLEAGEVVTLNSTDLVELGKKKFANTDKGLVPIGKLRKPTTTNVLDAEERASKGIAMALKDIEYPVDLYVEGQPQNVKVYAADSRQIKGDPKADIAMYDDSDNEIFWISHKKEGGAKAYQQYSGISNRSRLEHTEIDDFVQAVKDIVDANDGQLPHAVYRPVRDMDLINKAVFGPDYGDVLGRENVNILGQGDAIIEPIKDGEGIDLSFSEEVLFNGDGNKLTGSYLPVFAATFRNGRQMISKNNGIKVSNVRGGIYPIDMVKNRRGAKEI